MPNVTTCKQSKNGCKYPKGGIAKWADFNKKGRQDKESGQNAHFELWISGKPAFRLTTNLFYKENKNEKKRS